MPAIKRAVCTVLCAALLFGGQITLADAEKNPASAKGSKKEPATAEKPAAKATKAAASNEELLGAIEQLKSLVVEQTRELEAQRAALREQRERTEALERQLQTQLATVNAARPTQELEQKPEDLKVLEGQVEAMADSQRELGEKVSKVQADVTAAKRSTDGKLRQLGNFRFSGDVRIRGESFLQSGGVDRFRNRVRARFNLQGNITDELFGGISIATGSLDDPVSTNQTFTGFFNRKNVGFDRLFVTYKPKFFNNHVTLGGGKFSYPWVRTTLTFDSDVNPEGFYQQISYDIKTDVLKNLTLVGFQLPLSEVSGTRSSTTGAITAPGFDSWIFGAQLQSRWQLGSRTRLGLHVSGVNFINSDRIAAALGGALVPSLSNSNTLRTNASGAIVGYSARFLYLDTIAELGFNTGNAKFPLNITLNWVQNMRENRILQSGVAAPTGTANNRERSAYWIEVQVGRNSEQKDVQFGYSFIRVEQDAVVGAFNESDLRSATNVRNHRLNFSYRFLRNVTANYAIWLGKLANAQDNQNLVTPGNRLPGSACGTTPFTGCRDTLLKRMQFDLIYNF